MVATMMRGLLEGEKITAEDEVIARDVAGAIYLGTLLVLALLTRLTFSAPQLERKL